MEEFEMIKCPRCQKEDYRWRIEDDGECRYCWEAWMKKQGK